MGLVHNYMPFEAKAGIWHLAVWCNRALARLCHRCWGNDAVLAYLGTGAFRWRPLGPALAALSHTCPDGRPPLDWIGLNYYSRRAHALHSIAFCTPGHTRQAASVLHACSALPAG